MAPLVEIRGLERPDRAGRHERGNRQKRLGESTDVDSHAFPMMPIVNCVRVVESRVVVVWRKISISSGAALPVSSVRSP